MKIGAAIANLIFLALIAFIGGANLMWALDALDANRGYWQCYGGFFWLACMFRWIHTFITSSDEMPELMAQERLKKYRR